MYFTDGGYGNIGSVEVSTDQGTTWTELTVVDNLPDWQIAVGFDLSAYVGQSGVWIAFRQNDAEVGLQVFAWIMYPFQMQRLQNQMLL